MLSEGRLCQKALTAGGVFSKPQVHMAGLLDLELPWQAKREGGLSQAWPMRSVGAWFVSCYILFGRAHTWNQAGQ